MTPRDLDLDVVQSRVRLIQNLLVDLSTVGEISVERLERDRMLRHAVERVLTQIVELAVSVNSHVAASLLAEAPKDYRSSFSLAVAAGLLEDDLATRLRRSVGLRNVLTHEYVDVDLTIVSNAVGSALIDYGDYVKSAAGWIAERRTSDSAL